MTPDNEALAGVQRSAACPAGRRSQRPDGRLQVLAAVLVLALAQVFTPVLAGDELGGPDARILTSGFLHAHPDINHRLQGIEALDEGRFEHAFAAFRRSAWWADKSSQAMIAELLWNGQGAPRDRAAAYAWMDLAAERGYTVFAVLRERYWEQLDREERERALQVGKELYAEYGDARGRRRLETRLRFGEMDITGSRVGFVGPLRIWVNTDAGPWMLTGDQAYPKEYWRAEEYFALQDRIGAHVPHAMVEVGTLTTEPGSAHREDGAD